MKKFLYFLFWLNLGIIVYFWLSASLRFNNTTFSDYLLIAGRLAGLLAVFCVLMQFILIGRMPIIEQTFGLDKMARWHHKNGKYAYLFLILHLVFVLGTYAIEAKINILEQLVAFVTTYSFLMRAYISLMLYTLVVVCSLAIVRLKLRYETWYFVHLLVYIAILLPFLHQVELGGSFINPVFESYWYLIYTVVLGQFLIFRWLKPIIVSIWQGFVVSEVKQENYNTTSIYITGRNLNLFNRQSGQFMILRFFDKKRWWQAHPFSLSWAAANPSLRFSIKASGDFTSEINKIMPGTRVLIDGPHGVFTKKVLNKDKVLFIAGGVGITPIRSLIEDFGPRKVDMILLNANKTTKDILFEKELTDFASRFKLKVINIISEEKGLPSSSQSEIYGEHINEEMIKRLAPDFLEREVYLCGPQGMMDAVIASLTKIGIKRENIHFEKFSLH